MTDVDMHCRQLIDMFGREQAEDLGLQILGRLNMMDGSDDRVGMAIGRGDKDLLEEFCTSSQIGLRHRMLSNNHYMFSVSPDDLARMTSDFVGTGEHYTSGAGRLAEWDGPGGTDWLFSANYSFDLGGLWEFYVENSDFISPIVAQVYKNNGYVYRSCDPKWHHDIWQLSLAPDLQWRVKNSYKRGQSLHIMVHQDDVESFDEVMAKQPGFVPGPETQQPVPSPALPESNSANSRSDVVEGVRKNQRERPDTRQEWFGEQRRSASVVSPRTDASVGGGRGGAPNLT